MAVKFINITQFYAGMSPFRKIGVGGNIDAGGRFIKNLNIHQDPNHITQNTKTTKISGSTVTGLPLWCDDGTPYDTNVYFYDDDGKIYSLASNDTFSLLRTVTGSAGEGMLIFDDYLYYAAATTLGRYGRLSGTPAFTDDFLTDGSTNVDQSSTVTGQSYTVPTSIAETAAAKKSFTPTRDPITGIRVLVATKGTGDWTITLHDSDDTSLATATLTNANVTGSAYNTFTFSSPVRPIIGNEYHFHVTVSTGTSTVSTSTTADLETVAYATFFGILLDSGYHPMIEHLNFLVVGNKNYLATWNQALYNPNKITLAPGFEVRGLTKINEFVVAACWRGDSITGVEEGRLYFWDGFQTTFNFYKDIPMGLPNAIGNDRNNLVGVYGYKGSTYFGAEPYQKFMSLPNLDPTKKVEVYPGAISTFRERVMVGYSNTDDTDLNVGVYEIGSQQDGLPVAQTMSYTISTGESTGNSIKIGLVKGLGNKMFIGWEDDAAAGIDRVVESGDLFAAGSFESLVSDDGIPAKDKLAKRLVIYFKALATGQSVTPKYRINGATSWTSGDAVSTVGATQAELVFDNDADLRYKEIEIGFDIASSANTSMYIYSMYFEYDDLSKELNYDSP